jgi:hypothetical protein
VSLGQRLAFAAPATYEKRSWRRVSRDLPATVVAMVTVVAIIPIMPMVPPMHLLNDSCAISRSGLQASCLTHSG